MLVISTLECVDIFTQYNMFRQWGVCRYSLTRWHQLLQWGQNRDTEMAQLFQIQTVKATKIRIPFISTYSVIALFTYLLALKLWQEISERGSVSLFSHQVAPAVAMGPKS